MKRSALVNLLIGIAIALVPLYTRITVVDFNRTSKDNLMVVLFGAFSFLLGAKKRSLPIPLWCALIYSIFSLVFNQYNVISINVMFQTIYTLSGILFFANFHEKHDSDTTHFILKGMMAGAVIQSILAISNFYGFNLYFEFIQFVTGERFVYTGSMVNQAGSLGNSNLLGSYLSLTTLAFLSARRKWIAAIPLYALWLSHSYMGIGSFIMGTIYYLNLEFNIFKKWHLYSSAMIGMALVFFLGIKNGGSGRFEAWGRIFKLVDVNHFLFGKGPGWFADLKFQLFNGEFLVQEHNSFFTAFNFFGVVLFLILLPVFIKFLKSKDNKLFAPIVFAAFCNSFGHFSLHQSTVAIIIIVSASICLGENNEFNLER